MSMCETRSEQAYQDRPLTTEQELAAELGNQDAAYNADDLFEDFYGIGDELCKLLLAGKNAEAGELMAKVRTNTVTRRAQFAVFGECITPLFPPSEPVPEMFAGVQAALDKLTISPKVTA